MPIDDSSLSFTAAAAKIKAQHGRQPKEILNHELLLMDITTNIHEIAVQKCSHYKADIPPLDSSQNNTLSTSTLSPSQDVTPSPFPTSKFDDRKATSVALLYEWLTILLSRILHNSLKQYASKG
jgi:hypothetical protein